MWAGIIKKAVDDPGLQKAMDAKALACASKGPPNSKPTARSFIMTMKQSQLRLACTRNKLTCGLAIGLAQFTNKLAVTITASHFPFLCRLTSPRCHSIEIPLLLFA